MRRAATLSVFSAGLLVAGLVSAPGVHALAATSTTVLTDDVLPNLSALTPAGATDPSTAVQVGITFTNPNAAAQQAAYAAIYTPGSASYHQFLTPAQVAQQFGAPSTAIADATSWLTRDGLKAIYAASTNEYLVLQGTAQQAENTFSVSLDNYSWNSKTFFANTTGPTIPAGDGIAGVIGLNGLLRSTTFHSAPPSSAKHGTVPEQGTCAGSQCTGLTTPEDLWSIYGQPTNLADTTQDFGQGQQMAVLGEGAVAGPLGDLRAEEKEFGLPQIPITIDSLGDDFQDTSGSGEWDIDSQASTGMAPKAYGETWYFAKDLTDSSVLLDIQAFQNDPNTKEANASFGECEEDPTSAATAGGAGNGFGGLAGTAGVAFTTASENALQQATLEGKTLFSSTGDTGSSCPVVYAAVIGAGNGVANQAYPETNYPASSPYVTAVGGTVLYSNPNTATAPASNATRSEEYSWTFTGGGNTFYIPEPSYQQGIALLDNQPCISQPDGTPYSSTTPCRGIPDVASQSGDIATNGYSVVMAGTNDSQGAGTSLASPLWMGMWARIQAAAPVTGVGYTNGFANPALYKVGENATEDVNDFFDIGGSATTSPPTSNGYYTSLPRTSAPVAGVPADPSGWDYTSGLGAPNVTSLGRDITGNAAFSPTDNLTPPAPNDCGQVGLSPCASGGAICDDPLTLWTNPPHTATDTLGNSDPQLSLLKGGLTLDSTGTTLRALLTVTNLSATVPTGAGAAEWYMLWTYNGTTYFANAQLALGSSAPTYNDGTVTMTGSTHQYNNANTNDTGSFTTGPNGVVEIDVPLSHVGTPPMNAVLSQPTGETDILIGAEGTGSLPKVDSGGPSCDYTVGEVAPAANVPDVPFAPLLPLAGIGAVAVAIARRRRRGAATV